MFSGLLIIGNFEPFYASDGVLCKAMPCEQGLFLPLGWENELITRDINFVLRNDLSIIEEEI